MNAPINFTVPVAQENPVQIAVEAVEPVEPVEPVQVVDYVTRENASKPPFCNHKVLGIFMMLCGVAVGLAFGLGYGLNAKCR